MALDPTRLDPTGSGSKGTRTRAIYDHATDTIAVITAAGYFNAMANEMSRVAVLVIVAANGTTLRKVTTNLTTGVVTLAALDA